MSEVPTYGCSSAHYLLLLFRRFNVLFSPLSAASTPLQALFNTINIRSILHFLHSLPLPVFILVWSLPFLVSTLTWRDHTPYPPGVGLSPPPPSTCSPRYPYPPFIHPISSLYEFIPSHPIHPIHPYPSLSTSQSSFPPSWLPVTLYIICHLLPAPTFETTFTPPCPLPPEPSLLRIPNQIWYSARYILAVTANLPKSLGKRHREGEPAGAMKPF
ncbi:hypothetical protein BDP81DRAFT_429668 [Colletotrichum phormii]|uniref:Uncharacterized protein n=1 Tax=Colletotrichum phormii TaxID=359342 RepID=A0AAI9ZNU7_9PEZI|nr:uncharacterized protein BDP81DRAFT_429668 [Colletotrichum phormii]KAK1635419.1 hypothetical protein BDP81DRAFT_429668 [Colletotrichum phormii]